MKPKTDTVGSPFSDEMQFCSKHSSKSDVIDVDKCPNCIKPGKTSPAPTNPPRYAKNESVCPRCEGTKIFNGKECAICYGSGHIMSDEAQWFEKHQGEYIVGLGSEPRFDIPQMLDDYACEFGNSALFDYNEHDAEDCGACMFVSESLCPYHFGVEAGVKMHRKSRIKLLKSLSDILLIAQRLTHAECRNAIVTLAEQALAKRGRL